MHTITTTAITLAKLGIKCLIPFKVSKKHALSPLQKQINLEIGKRRICIEHINGKLKVFKILSERYWNRRKRMGLRLKFDCCNLQHGIA